MVKDKADSEGVEGLSREDAAELKRLRVLGWSTTAMVSRYAQVVALIHSDVASRLDLLLWSSPDSATNDRN